MSTFKEVERNVLQPLYSDSEGLIGADDLLPMAIFVTIKARCALYEIWALVFIRHKLKKFNGSGLSTSFTRSNFTNRIISQTLFHQINFCSYAKLYSH